MTAKQSAAQLVGAARTGTQQAPSALLWQYKQKAPDRVCRPAAGSQASHAFAGRVSRRRRLRHGRRCGVAALMCDGHASFGGAAGGARRCGRVNGSGGGCSRWGLVEREAGGVGVGVAIAVVGGGCRAARPEESGLFWSPGRCFPKRTRPCPVLKHVVWPCYTTLVRR